MNALHDEAKRLAGELISMGGANVHINQAADTLLNLAHAASLMEVMRDAALTVAEANAKSGAAWAARVQELEAQLEAIGAGGVSPLMARGMPEQMADPVAWADEFEFRRDGHDFWANRQRPSKGGIPLYTDQHPLMAPASPALANYDPNMDWSEQTVEITYQSWYYRATVQVQIGGNCMGHSVMESALSSHADKLVDEQGEYPDLVLTNAAGDTLETSFDNDTNGDVEGWLSDMCVGLRIIKQAEE